MSFLREHEALWGERLRVLRLGARLADINYIAWAKTNNSPSDADDLTITRFMGMHLAKEVQREPKAASLLAGLLKHNDYTNLASSTRAQLSFMIQWARTGCPALKVDPQTVAMFMNTSVDKISLKEAGIPFDNYSIEVQPSPYLYFINTRREQCPVSRILVHRSSVELAGDSVWIHAASRSHGITLYSNIPLAAKIEDFEGEEFNYAPPGDLDNLEMQSEDDTCAALVKRIVVGLSLWLEECKGSGSGLVRVPQRQKKTKKQAVPDRTYIVKPVHVSPELAQALKDQKPGVIGWKVRNKFMVRGHWRQQPCGPSRVERRRTWIKPHWKGPTDGPTLPREYEVHTDS